MKPYLYIDEKEWKHIIDTYEKDDVIEELMDAICYLTKLKQDLIKMNKKIGFRGAKKAIQELLRKFDPKVRKK